jgi:hypothetical protein
VRHGHPPEREIMTDIGPVVVREARGRDREVAAGDSAFASRPRSCTSSLL